MNVGAKQKERKKERKKERNCFQGRKKALNYKTEKK